MFPAANLVILSLATIIAVLTWSNSIAVVHGQNQNAIVVCNANKGAVGDFANPQDTLCQQ